MDTCDHIDDVHLSFLKNAKDAIGEHAVGAPAHLTRRVDKRVSISSKIFDRGTFSHLYWRERIPQIRRRDVKRVFQEFFSERRDAEWWSETSYGSITDIDDESL